MFSFADLVDPVEFLETLTWFRSLLVSGIGKAVFLVVFPHSRDRAHSLWSAFVAYQLDIVEFYKFLPESEKEDLVVFLVRMNNLVERDIFVCNL